jgi:dihydropteroate synthase
MGILNLDSESFYKPSITSNLNDALNRVERMIYDGMDLLDIGAFSSRPGMKIPSYEDERIRLFPLLPEIQKSFPDLIISVDTMRADIAKEAIESGVDIINDISSGNFDANLPELVGRNNKIYIAMHMKGLPENMMSAEHTAYEDVIHEIIVYFSEKLKQFYDVGLYKVIIDPGFGFSKNRNHSYTLLKNLNMLEILDCPILAGISRKSMIWKTLNINAEDSLVATKIAEFYATLKGCNIVRVHDIKETRQMLDIYHAIQLA